MFNIVLHEPRMPGNVGTIGRTAVALKCKLHLIKPYGFGDITEKEVRRAGLDYWKDLELFEYENIEDFWAKNPFSSRHFFATTKTTQAYFEAKFEVGDYIYFGREDAGLPQYILFVFVVAKKCLWFSGFFAQKSSIFSYSKTSKSNQ